ncbi:MAG TPA: class I SAM-dependent methyltransferase [Aliidongia sp.]|uniref:O-methyltransferase n=1 Tax=Aliidongia sp. TaxID=1914230 RepID=UPI002DDD9EE5|nr:class I SAM-dependent methyltransferase [Aliidongia sp.]HEV2674310.1 class I SAM-dependent methyltransferase [Aliidongia sp.]
MAKRITIWGEAADAYVVAMGTRETALQADLRAETSAIPHGGMQIGPDQGQFLGFLVGLLGARRVLEIGTFTGYSALAMARALPADGHLHACDVNREWTDVGRRYWGEAGIADKITLHLGPALDTLTTFAPDGFDLAFIDADKTSYDAYYEACLKLVRPGGVLALDNMLWSGAVADMTDMQPDTLALRTLNAKIKADERVDMSLLPIGDGLMLARRR